MLPGSDLWDYAAVLGVKRRLGAMMLERSRTPSSTTAMAVSSQEVSIPKIFKPTALAPTRGLELE